MGTKSGAGFAATDPQGEGWAVREAFMALARAADISHTERDCGGNAQWALAAKRSLERDRCEVLEERRRDTKCTRCSGCRIHPT